MAGVGRDDREPDAMFSYVSAEQWVPPDHPLRAIRAFDQLGSEPCVIPLAMRLLSYYYRPAA